MVTERKEKKEKGRGTRKIKEHSTIQQLMFEEQSATYN